MFAISCNDNEYDFATANLLNQDIKVKKYSKKLILSSLIGTLGAIAIVCNVSSFTDSNTHKVNLNDYD